MSLAASCGLVGQCAIELISDFRTQVLRLAESSDDEQLIVYLCAHHAPSDQLSPYSRHYWTCLFPIWPRARGSQSVLAPALTVLQGNKRRVNAAAYRIRAVLHRIVIDPWCVGNIRQREHPTL